MKLPKFLHVFKHFSYLQSKQNKTEKPIESSPLEKFVPKEEEEDVHQYKHSGNSIKRLGAPLDTESLENIDQKKNKKSKRNTIKLFL